MLTSACWPSFYLEKRSKVYFFQNFKNRKLVQGDQSEYKPLINVIDNNAILLHWHEDIISELEDPYIKKEVTLSIFSSHCKPRIG